MWDICIIGGGASGLAAAISAAQAGPHKPICILEKKETAGKKLAATGNGKCNLSNEACIQKDLTIQFFRSMGVLTRTEDQGRMYPYALQAKDVVYAMVNRAESLGVKIQTHCRAEHIERKESGFQIAYENGVLQAKKVLIATGGKAAPQFGTTGDGYLLAKTLGHTVTRLAPVLTGIEVKEHFEHLKGVRVRAQASLYKDGEEIAREPGEVQFNADGISGICIFNLSRMLKLEQGEAFVQGMKRYIVHLDFLPEIDLRQVQQILDERCGIAGFKASDLLLSILPYPLGKVLIKGAGIDLKKGADKVSDHSLWKLAQLTKGWKLSIKGTKGWKAAQCTSGGVPLSEINMDTMESVIASGLYFAGEIIDFDGPCGGFNLQNAWETGIKAGEAMVASL